MKRLLLLSIVFILFSGCIRIWLDPKIYSPAFSVDTYLPYKGKDLFFTIYNRSTNSDWAYYYSDSHPGTRYTSWPTINAYLQEAYQKAFIHAGFTVYESQPTQKVVPELRIYINSLSDEKMIIEPQLLLDEGIRFKKLFTVTLPATDGDLEKNAYKMIDLSVVTILNDPDFQEKYFAITP